MNIKISIIVPVYNVYEYVGKCLDSLIHQSLKDIEIIVVDDCGNDKSMSVVQQYAEQDKRIKIIKNPQNLGLSESRNIGLTHAHGEYIAFLDSDDFVENDYYQKLYIAIHNNEADIAYSNVAEFYSETQIVYKNWFYEKLFLDRVKIAERAVDKQYIIYACCCWNKLYKKSFLDKYKFKFPKNLYIEDIPYTFMTTMMANKLVAVENATLFYRQRNNSIMAQAIKDRKSFDIFKIFTYIEQQLASYENISSEYKKILDVFKISQFWGWYIKCPFKYKMEFLKEVKMSFNKIDLSGNTFVSQFECEKYKYVIKDITKRRALYIFNYLPIFEIKKENFSKIVKIFNLEIFRRFFDTTNLRLSVFKIPLFTKIKQNNLKIISFLGISYTKQIGKKTKFSKKSIDKTMSIFKIITIQKGTIYE